MCSTEPGSCEQGETLTVNVHTLLTGVTGDMMAESSGLPVSAVLWNVHTHLMPISVIAVCN